MGGAVSDRESGMYDGTCADGAALSASGAGVGVGW